MDLHIVATDIVYQEMESRYAVAVKNLAVQVFYTGTYSVNTEGIDYMHSVYKNANIDYKDYAVPKGYGYGKVCGTHGDVIDSCTKASNSCKKATGSPKKAGGSHKRPFISVYAIAKNEERFVERWYNCFKEADEVCVLVNNSTDKTEEILRRLGAKVKVINYANFRFDVALNDAMKMCSPKAELLFKTDIDDVVKPGWRQKIEHAWELGKATGKNPNSILFTYVVVWGDKPSDRQPMVRHSIHTPDGWYWHDRVHEVLEHKDHKTFICYPKFEVESHSEPNKDHSAYLPLLEQDAADGGSADGRTMHLLGREYMQYGRYDEAIETFKKHLAMPGAIWNCERAASMKFIADCYAFKGDEAHQETWLWKSMLEDDKDRDAPYVLGMLLIRHKEFFTAVQVLEKCLSIEKPQLDFPIFQLAAWGEHPWMLLGEAYFHSGRWLEGKSCLEKALSINPDNELAKTMLGQMEAAIKNNPLPQPPYEVPRLRLDIPELM